MRRRHRLCQLTQIVLVSVPVLCVSTGTRAAAETCCERSVVVDIAVGPPGVSAMNVNEGFAQIFTNARHGGGPLIRDCSPPLKVMVYTLGASVPAPDEYVFQGTLISPSPLAYSLAVQLVDRLHGEVVKQGSTVWTCAGEITCSAEVIQHVHALARNFQPLDALLYHYEAMPQSAGVKPEKDPVYAEERISIDVEDIRSGQGGEPKPWQRILVKVEEGEILNGQPRGEYRVFDVGGGSVQISYEAPDICEDKTETLTVYNSCHTDPSSLPPGPDDEIASKDIDLEPKVKGKLDWTVTVTSRGPAGLVNLRGTGEVRFEVDHDKDPPEISGEGSLVHHLDGAWGVCTFETTKGEDVAVKLGGNLVEGPDGEALLRFEVENRYGNYAGIGQCGAIRGPFSGGNVGGPLKFQLEFPVEDGHFLEWEVRGVRTRGMKHVTLELDCPSDP